MGDSLSYLDNLLSTYINQVSIAKKGSGFGHLQVQQYHILGFCIELCIFHQERDLRSLKSHHVVLRAWSSDQLLQTCNASTAQSIVHLLRT